MFASQRRLPSSMFTSEAPIWRIVVRSSCSHSRAVAASRMSGSVTISTSGVPPRLKSTRLAPEPWIRPDSRDVDQLRRVLLEVDAMDADVAEPAAGAERDVVLADLVRLRIVGIEVVLAVEDRPRRDLAAEREADLEPVAGSPSRSGPAATRDGRGRSGRCGRSGRRRTRARSRRTSSSASGAGRGSRGR